MAVDLRGADNWRKLSPTFRSSINRRYVRRDFKAQLEDLTKRVHAARVIARALVEGEQTKRALAMVTASAGKVMIKGLSESIAAARKSIAEARLAPVAVAEAAAALKATCDDLASQVNAVHDDIKFEATQLGNGGEAASDVQSKTESQQPETGAKTTGA